MDPLASLSSDPATWESHVRSLDADARKAIGKAIAHEWIEGRLEPRLVGNALRDALTTLRRLLARVLDACELGEYFSIESRNINPDESAARKWCWIAPWILLSQDEDLFLMEDSLIVPMLEEATAGCVKRDYVFAIAEHHVRDQVFDSLRAGPDAVRARITELTKFRAPAIAAGHPSLPTYLDRLESYAHPQSVEHLDACTRVSDLWRCKAPSSVEIEPLLRGEWRAKLAPNGNRQEWIVIDQKTGAMRLHTEKKH